MGRRLSAIGTAGRNAGIALPRLIGTKAYRGRKPSYSRKQLECAHAMLGKSAGVGEVAKVHWATRQMVYRIKDDVR
jgi:putative DNA-invertase from lambdoid prophage Rac